MDRIDNVINKVDQTISSGERAQNTADRVMDKIPEKEEQPAPAQPAAATPTTSTDEEAILQQAREIEERRILEAAERIKEERAATAGNQ